MTVICLTEYNRRRYAVAFENIVCVKLQNFEDISDYENNLLYIKPSETFSGKSAVCDMTMMSVASDRSVYDGNTILHKNK